MKNARMPVSIVNSHHYVSGLKIVYQNAEGFSVEAVMHVDERIPKREDAITVGNSVKWEFVHCTNVKAMELDKVFAGAGKGNLYPVEWLPNSKHFVVYDKEPVDDSKPFVLKKRERFSGPKVTLSVKDLVKVKDDEGAVHTCKPSSIPAKGERPNDYYFAVTQMTGPDTETVVWVHAANVTEIGVRDPDGAIEWTPVEHSHHSLWDEFYEVVPLVYINSAVIKAQTIEPPTMTDYKGHKNLAEMVKGHLGSIADALRSRRHYCQLTFDHDNAAYWDHELTALLDIEKAIRADLGEECEAHVEFNDVDTMRVEPAARAAFATDSRLPPQPSKDQVIATLTRQLDAAVAELNARPTTGANYHLVANNGVDICGVVGCGKFKDDKAQFCPNHTAAIYADEQPERYEGQAIDLTFTAATEPQPTAQEAREQAWGGTITPDPVAGLHTQRTALEFDTHISVSLHTLRGILTDAVNVYERGAYDSVEDLVSARMYVVALTHKIE